MKNQWRVIVGFLLVLIIVIFAVLNNQSVPVRFGFVQISGPLILIILGSAIIGAIVGLITSATTMWQQKKQIKELEKEAAIYKNDGEKLVAEEVEKVKREYENQLTELKAKYEADTGKLIEEETVGDQVDYFSIPKDKEEGL